MTSSSSHIFSESKKSLGPRFIVCARQRQMPDVIAYWGFFVSHLLLPWWRHQMETFSALLAICAGNSPVPDEFPTQRPVTRSFDVSFDLRPNKWLSKQSWGYWFVTLSCSLWRHRNAIIFPGAKLLVTHHTRISGMLSRAVFALLGGEEFTVWEVRVLVYSNPI